MSTKINKPSDENCCLTCGQSYKTSRGLFKHKCPFVQKSFVSSSADAKTVGPQSFDPVSSYMMECLPSPDIENDYDRGFSAQSFQDPIIPDISWQ
jgi:hypothetical protein